MAILVNEFLSRRIKNSILHKFINDCENFEQLFDWLFLLSVGTFQLTTLHYELFANRTFRHDV